LFLVRFGFQKKIEEKQRTENKEQRTKNKEQETGIFLFFVTFVSLW